MTRDLGCPDDRLGLLGGGVLSPEDEARVRAHVDGCRACAAMAGLRGSFAGAGASRPGDDAIVARMAARTAAAFAGRASQTTSPRITRAGRTRRWTAAVAAGLALLFTAATGTALWMASRRADVATVEPTPAPARPVRPPRVVPMVAPEPPAASPPVRPAVPSAAALFSDANRLRREGRVGAAVSAYQRLQGLHPASDEANMARLSLGEITLGTKPALALAQFDAYLARRGPLAEEALVGRCRALAALSRPRDERACWSRLLAEHPGSIYRDHARRLVGSRPE